MSAHVPEYVWRCRHCDWTCTERPGAFVGLHERETGHWVECPPPWAYNQEGRPKKTVSADPGAAS